MNLVEIPFVPGTVIYAPKDLAATTIEQLRGRVCGFSLDDKNPISPIPGEPPIRRIIDVGAGIGAFAAYATLRWPYAWIDCYEEDQTLAAILKLNLPPGARIVTREEVEQSRCDLLHLGDPTGPQPRLDDLKIAILESMTGDVFASFAEIHAALGMRLVGAGVFDVDAAWQAWAHLKEA